MKLEFILLTVCLVIWVDAFRVTREAEEPKECCYPRPPPREDRGFKKHASRCCEFPVAELWQKFYEDLESCKEVKKQENGSTTTTTTPAPLDKENETDNEFDADLPDASVETEKEETPSSTATPSSDDPKEHDHQGHKGRGKGGKHRGGPGRGKCMKETMEKHGWEGSIEWDAILLATEKASNASADEWVPIVREAITNCSKQAAITSQEQPEKGKGHGRHHCPHHQMTPEKKAWRCIINNSIMKCPNFPETNEYCASLRKAHEECLATKSGYGPAQFKWCGEPRKHHAKRPKH